MYPPMKYSFLLVILLLLGCQYEEDRIASTLEGRWNIEAIAGDTLSLVRPDTATFTLSCLPCQQAYTSICRWVMRVEGNSGLYTISDTVSVTLKSNEITMIDASSPLPNYQQIWRSRRYTFSTLTSNAFILNRFDYPAMYVQATKLP
jgi:hypothetical protein